MENYLVGKLRGAEPPKGRALALRSPLLGRLAQHPSLPGGPRLGASSFGTATHTQRLFRNAYFLVFVLFCFANFVIIASLYEQTQLLRGVVAWLRRPMSQKNRPRAGRRRPAPRSGFSNPAGRAVVQWPRPAPPWAAARREPPCRGGNSRFRPRTPRQAEAGRLSRARAAVFEGVVEGSPCGSRTSSPAVRLWSLVIWRPP